MTQEQLKNLLLEIKHRLGNYCGIEPEDYQGSIVVRDFIAPDRKHIPEEISKIISDAHQSLSLPHNLTHWPQTIESRVDLVIRYVPD